MEQLSKLTSFPESSFCEGFQQPEGCLRFGVKITILCFFPDRPEPAESAMLNPGGARRRKY